MTVFNILPALFRNVMHRNSHGNVSDRFGSLQLRWHVKHELLDPGISRVKGSAVGWFQVWFRRLASSRAVAD